MAVTVDRSAIVALRRARFRHRIAHIDFFEALYRAYLTAIGAGVAIVALSGVTGDRPVTGHRLVLLTQHGAAAIGAVVALGVAVALRSAGRGGPLALEAADVRHLLLAPVDRNAALRGPAFQQLRSGAFAGSVCGAIVGVVAWRDLHGSPAAWILACGAVGGLAGVGCLGAGLAASGRRLPRLAAMAVGVAVVAWSAADLYLGTVTSPLTMLGQLALWPLRVHLEALVGVAVTLALAVVGLFQVGGLSIEAAERRATLVGQLRFAATTRDLRTVMVLRRQLSQERSRRRPWLPLGRRPGRSLGLAIWKRGWQGILRWPARRFLRLVVLGAVAGVCLRLVWSGTTALVVIAALALWVAALDSVEPLAQEVDRTDRLSSFPHVEGWVLLRHLAVPSVLMIGVCLVGLGVAAAMGGSLHLVAAVGGLTVIPAALAAVGGATVSVVREPQVTSDVMALQPELAGIKTFLRELIPPTVAFIGLLPVLVAHHAAATHHPPLGAAINWAVIALVAPIGTFSWLSRRSMRPAGPAPERVGQA
ncbi:MAG TPA: hypothetical protein VE152_14345 [Acidimicrobiales bacterium]|nr:hypothetical protein [Acidimicrobiales bacterium]